MKLDLLAFGAHADDVELSCSGTLLKQISLGKKAGIIDLTRGELGTRGTPAIREREAQNAAQIMGIDIRENLGMRDGFFVNDEVHQLQVIRMIRKYQPEIILANAIHDRHPDHGRAAQLIEDSSFLSGLRMIETVEEDIQQDPWRPRVIYHYIQDEWIEPDLVVDISVFLEKKLEAIRAFQSQFFDPKSREPETYISRPDFIDSLIFRAQESGKMIGAKYGEGFTSRRKTGVDNLFHLK
ncbi:MAG: bacillithiol biosynthesis deacetylase BshB1 [Chitinophagaceae bacterium]|nr:bacillithiol biosynthesis deacetylase BshB1 [Chitinophagaceae bacterium]